MADEERDGSAPAARAEAPSSRRLNTRGMAPSSSAQWKVELPNVRPATDPCYACVTRNNWHTASCWSLGAKLKSGSVGMAKVQIITIGRAQRDLDAIGAILRPLWPIDRAPCFSRTLQDLGEAERELCLRRNCEAKAVVEPSAGE